MSLGLREERKRRRQQFRWSLIKWASALALIVVAGLYAYETGSELARQETHRLEQEIGDLSAKVGELEQLNDEQRSTIEAERQRLEALQGAYARDVPAGEVKELHDLMRTKLSAGVTVDRLRFVLSAAENLRDCDQPTAPKRLVVKTPHVTGANNAVTVGDGAVTVSASGTSARDQAGNPEAWFDPTEPVTLQLIRLGGESSEVSGVLPLHPSVVVGDSEYRFSLVAGSRGFVNISSERCAYP